MFAWYGLMGGVHNVEGFRVYPAGNDPYGNDIIGPHTHDFNANVVISLIDVWVMKDTAQKIAPALWCVPGYTLVEMNDGHKLPIKDLYNMKGNRRAVLGHDGTQAVEGLITDYHYMGVKPTLEIETMTGRRLRITAESGIYVNRNGCAEWIAASCVTPGDMVYCIAGSHNLLGGNNDQLGTKTHDGMAVSDRLHANSGRTVGLGTQPELRAARSGNLANTPRVELEEVRSVRSTGVLEPVYDLTTSTHNFFANGILIHNCPWLPIDHDPVPQIVLDCLQGAHLPLTYSKWGHQLLADAGVDNLYIPHGIEPSIYRVNENQDAVSQFRQEKLRGVDHLTVMVAANKGFPDRKAFQVQLRSWAKFAKDKPDAKLYIHTEPSTRYGGVDMFALLRNLGIGDRVYFPNQYEYSKGYSAEYLAMMYNAADVFMGAAMAEGFGIPIIEAQACGTPVIVTDFSSMPELVRWGYKVQPRDMWWSPLNAWQAWPDVDGITEALEELYAQWHDQGDRWELRQRLWASSQIHNEYSWDTITRDQWAPLMTRLAGEVAQPEPVATEPVQGPTVPPKRRVKLERVGPVIEGEHERVA
jgi:glycosyltransferase involved in cell wall biosynthesis